MADRARLARLIELQAEACAQLGSPLYAGLLAAAAADARAGGPVAQVLAGHEDAPGPAALALRLMGGVHRLVLDGDAPELAAYFPSVGGRADPAAAWPAFRATVAGHHQRLRELLDVPPQTNEVGRAGALVGGLLLLLAALPEPLPVRLVELGASAGLNLRADHFRITGAGVGHGPPDSPVQLREAWTGAAPPVHLPLRVTQRVGCDLAPLDPLSAAGRTQLTCYVWADQTERLDRLRGALQVAAVVPAVLHRMRAAALLADLEPEQGALTVVWHSVMWQYVGAAERAAITQRLGELGRRASSTAPVAHLSLEPRRRQPGSEHEFLLTARLWPHRAEEVLLAGCQGHGVPARWEVSRL